MIPKVIIDCDPGPDDAMAIFMMVEAHKRNQIEIIALTTVNGNSTLKNVNENTLKILNVAGIQIPVYSGASQPLVFPFIFPEYPFFGKDGFGDNSHLLSETADYKQISNNESAAFAIIRLIEENPGEVILAAIGPLTNIGLVLNLKPETFSLLKDFYVMGGNVTGEGNITPAGEFNFVVDPEAAKIVLDRMPLQIKLVPWEVCVNHISITYEERKSGFGCSDSPAFRFLNIIEANSITNSNLEHYTTCDQLVAAWILDEHTQANPSLVTKTDQHLATVEVMGSQTRGLMVLNKRHSKQSGFKPNVIALCGVNKDKYIEYLKMAFA